MLRIVANLAVCVCLYVSLTLTSFAMTLAIPLPQTGQTKCYSGDYYHPGEIPCAGTGQDGELQNGLPWPTPRFVDNSDGTVTDKLTGLIWLKNANCFGGQEWVTAVASARSLASDQCGLTDGSSAGQWHLPSRNELASLVNSGQVDSASQLNSHGFSGVQSGIYWSSSTYATGNPLAYVVYMNYGSVNSNHKTFNSGVWPVRGEQSIAAPAPVAKSGQTTSYASGDDGDLEPGVDWPIPRFSDNGDQTITDNLTRLIWSKSGNAPGPAVCGTGYTKTWQGAQDYVKCLNNNYYLGYSDWSLPNRNELQSLGQVDSASWLNSQGFSGVQPGIYWSSTYASPAYAWSVNTYGHVIEYPLYGGFYVWPVRSGHYWVFDDLYISGHTQSGVSPVGSVSAPRQFVISNRLDTATAITSIGMSGASADEFSVAPGGTNPCASSAPVLAPGESCTVQVTFAPLTAGAKTANLTTNTASGSKVIPVTATAIATVYGSATDYATGLPLTGATVTLVPGDKSATTADDGRYTFGDLAASLYTVTISKTGYQTLTYNNLTVNSSSSARVDAWLPPPGFLNLPTQQPSPASPNLAYSYRMKTVGGTYPYHYTLDWGSLPVGLSLNPATGEISGVPAADSEGSYTISIGVTDAVSGYAAVQLTINVASPLIITGYPGILSRTGQTTCHDSTGAVIACTATRQDGDLQMGLQWPNPRFTDKGNGTTEDILTGLIWAKDANLMKNRDTSFDTADVFGDGMVDWAKALDYVSKLNQERYLGFSDWRLPNINELESLMPSGQSDTGTWLSSQGFSNVPAGNYWSSTTNAYSTSSAWYVKLMNNSVEYSSKTTNFYHVWPVRDGDSCSGVIALPRTGQSSSYAAGDDGAFRKGIAWPNPRFSTQPDQTVIDNLTGLKWEQNPANRTACSTNKTWQSTLDYVVCLNANMYLGHNDWRLPNKKEMSSLLNRGESNSATWLNGQGFTNFPPDFHWSANHVATAAAFGVYLYTGRVALRPTLYTLPDTGEVRVVRGGIPVVANSVTLSKGMVGTAYNSRVSMTGGVTPYSCSITSEALPAGLTLTNSGGFTGTPTTAGSYTFSVTVTDAAGRTAISRYSITILPKLTITTTRLNDAFTNTPYSMSLTGSGGDGSLTWSITSGTLPAGFTLDPTTSAISGTATSASTRQVTLTLNDGSGRTVSKALTLNVVDTLSITTTALADAHVGVVYSQTVQKSGGIAPYTFNYTGQLPAGLSLNTSTGIISSTPTTSGYVNFGITVIDSTYPTPQNVNKTLSIRTVIDLPLNVQVTGTGSGTVTSTPAQVSCLSGTCTYQVGTGYTVLLHAEPFASSTFSGWSNACTGTGNCSVLMSSAKTAVANFAIKTFPVTVSLIGDGTVSSNVAVLSCSGSTCSGTFNYGTVLTLTPVPDSGNALTGWGGPCSGLGTCTVTVTDATSINAAFNSGKVLTVTIAGNGSGTITGNPAGLSCHSGACSYSYPTGEQVTLLDTVSVGSLFNGYSGTCAGDACSLTMDASKNVTATFTSPQPAKIGSVFYPTVQQAYTATAPTGSVIMLKEGEQTGPLTANSDKVVTINGGYNPAYSGTGDDSVITGGIFLKHGTVIFNEVSVR